MAAPLLPNNAPNINLDNTYQIRITPPVNHTGTINGTFRVTQVEATSSKFKLGISLAVMLLAAATTGYGLYSANTSDWYVRDRTGNGTPIWDAKDNHDYRMFSAIMAGLGAFTFLAVASLNFKLSPRYNEPAAIFITRVNPHQGAQMLPVLPQAHHPLDDIEMGLESAPAD
jgi:hypothetical protein